ncbi:MAG: hypothetical protein NT003_02140 [Candidatus Magasanikbacteria bacterium]|nr:hypothetical protein [Candidatus Magasanikbacteria bacterium]
MAEPTTLDNELRRTSPPEPSIIAQADLTLRRVKDALESKPLEKIELPRKNGGIDIAALLKIGKGGTHDVYSIPNHEEYVIKINRELLKRRLQNTDPTLPPEIRTQGEQYIADEQKKRDALRIHFGAEHCLKEDLFIDKITIVTEGQERTVEAMFTQQATGEGFANPTKIDMSIDYKKNALEAKKIRYLFQAIEEDKELQAVVQEFLNKFKTYVEIYDFIPDLVGEENVLFYKKDGNWTYQIGSVIKGETLSQLNEALKFLEKDPAQIDLDRRKKSALANGFAVGRLVNALGAKLRIGTILPITSSDEQRMEKYSALFEPASNPAFKRNN